VDRRSFPLRMLLSKQKDSVSPGQLAPSVHRQGIILSKVATPSGFKLVQLLLNQERERDDASALKISSAAPTSPLVHPTQATTATTVNNVCTICGDSFTQKLAFNAHIKVHLKEKLKKKRAQLVEKQPTTSDQTSQPTNSRLLKDRRTPPATTTMSTVEADLANLSRGNQIKTEPTQPHIDQQPSSNLLSSSLTSECQDSFVASEFSKSMEINRVDLNNDISSILDQIEKDFDDPNIQMSSVRTETPPISEPESGQFWNTFLNQQTSNDSKTSFTGQAVCPSPMNECCSPSSLANNIDSIVSVGHSSIGAEDYQLLPETFLLADGQPAGPTAAASPLVTDGVPVKMESSLSPESDTPAPDHDYLMTSQQTTSSNHLDSLDRSSLTAPQLTSLAGDGLGGVLGSMPGRIIIHRSAGDSSILNIFSIGRINPHPVEHQGEPAQTNQPSQPSQPSQPAQPLTFTAGVSPQSRLGSSEERDLPEELDSTKMKIARNRQSADCSVCGKLITTKNMARHMEKHTGKKKFKCDVCQAAFFQKTHLKNHVMLHDSNTYLECADCGQRFLRRADYQKHVNTVHAGRTPTMAVCHDCGSQFSQVHKLEEHKRKHHHVSGSLCNEDGHTSERQELCGLCGEKFQSKSAMISHMHKHTNSNSSATHKPFSCNVCHKTFSQKSHLNRHIKSHGGEQDLVCLVCDKQCKNKVELVRHRASHVACNLCESLFDNKVQLQQHLIKSHLPVQPPALNSVSPAASSLHLFDDEMDGYRPMSRGSVDILSSNLDSSPAPSSIDSHLDILDGGPPHFLVDFKDPPESVMEEESQHNLSLQDISDSSFFDIQHHLDEDILVHDIFPCVK